ncbi:AraC family transcriptional regulator [Priestia megaterium]
MTRFKEEVYLESSHFPFSIKPHKFNPNEIFNLHSHEFIQVVYVKEGSGIHTYNHSSYPISQGDIFIIEPEIEHSYHIDMDHHLLVYNIMFQPQLLSRELEALINVTPFVDFFYMEPFFRKTVDFTSKLTLDIHQQIEFNFLLDCIHEEYREKQSGYRFLIQIKLIEMFLYISRSYDNVYKNSVTYSLSDAQVIEKISRFIEKYHASSLSLKQVSQLCGMSQSTFTAKFKEYTGITFIQYRNNIRLRMAKEFLSNTDLKIISIAQEVGFDDVSNFNKMFKQNVGKSPKQYRRENRI